MVSRARVNTRLDPLAHMIYATPNFRLSGGLLLLGCDAGHVDGTLRNVEGVLVVEVVSQVTEAPDLPAAPGVQLVGMVYLQDLTQVGNDVLERL